MDTGAATRADRGAVATIVAASLVALFGMVALVVDVGELYVVRAELQSAADAAAIAAAEQLDDPVAAMAAAQLMAGENHSAAAVDSSDIEFGQWDPVLSEFLVGVTPYDSVRVTVRRTEATGNPVDHSFAGVIGNPESDVVASAVAKANRTLIDFEDGFSSGDIPTQLSHGNGVSGDVVAGYVTLDGYDFTSSGGDGGNTPMIFDATCGGQPNNCTGGDNDLYQPGQGNVLILSEDGDSSDPDDEAHGGYLEFDFSNFGDGQVTIGSLVVVDSEATRVVRISLYREGVLIAVSDVPGAGDGQVETRFPTEVPDIDFMTVEFEDSGAIDNIGYTSGVSLVQ